jgi:hypothetical protein
VNDPLAVGVPVIAPVVLSRVRPAGKLPAVTTENVNGAVPPVTVIAGLLIAAPTSPELTAGQLSTGTVATVNVQVVVAVIPAASFT